MASRPDRLSGLSLRSHDLGRSGTVVVKRLHVLRIPSGRQRAVDRLPRRLASCELAGLTPDTPPVVALSVAEADFTELSEKLPAVELVNLLNACFGTAQIERYEISAR
jgi:hypothetical protein